MNITAVVHPRVWLQLNDFSLCGSCSEVVSKLGVAMPHPLDSSPRTMEVKGEMMSGVGHSLRDSQRVLGSQGLMSSYRRTKKTGLGLCHTPRQRQCSAIWPLCKSTQCDEGLMSSEFFFRIHLSVSLVVKPIRGRPQARVPAAVVHPTARPQPGSVARCSLPRLVLALGSCYQLWCSALGATVPPLVIAALSRWNKNPPPPAGSARSPKHK